MNLKEQSEADTPKCGDNWINASLGERESWVKDVLAEDVEKSTLIEITGVRDDGQITLRFRRQGQNRSSADSLA
jgi:hypothetical protein